MDYLLYEYAGCLEMILSQEIQGGCKVRREKSLLKTKKALLFLTRVSFRNTVYMFQNSS
jgi:hypothetical protein